MVLRLMIMLAALAIVAVAGAWRAARRRHLQNWLGPYVRQVLFQRRARGSQAGRERLHVLLCIADHFEPAAGGASREKAAARVDAWVEEYPIRLGEFRDSDGRPPRHTFFYPIDQYDAQEVDLLAGLCGAGFGEIEIHLHHDDDNAADLARMLRRFTHLFAERHGLLGRWPSGRIAYGFVHGNWALDNSRPDGRWCGVDNELGVLRRTGCYADFTMPSVPDATQTRKINSIYYAAGRPGRRKSHDAGIDARVSAEPADGLMLIQGPLRIWRPRGEWRPRIENGCIQHGQPLSQARLDQWIRAGVGVRGRPDWVFVKLHTHGAIEGNREELLGARAMEFHRALARRAARDPGFCFHYVTAREMYNLAKAAEAGWTGSVQEAMDRVVSPPRQILPLHMLPAAKT